MQNIERKLNEHFSNDSSFIKYPIIKDNNLLSNIYYFEGLVDLEKIGEIIIKKYELNQKLILFPNVKEEKDYNAVIQKIIDGNVVVFDYTENRIYSVELRRLYLRSVAEPDNEKIIKGPREGLIENIITNNPFNLAILSSSLFFLYLAKNLMYPPPNPRLKIDNDEIVDETVLYSP